MPDPSESRFASSTHTAEDLLKEQTVGLVHYSDFRKRRAEALEQSGGSGASTPTGNESRYVFCEGRVIDVAFLTTAKTWTETDGPSTVSRRPNQPASRSAKRA